ncbi:MAG: sensor histidine kinase [Acidimicrobiales bacterium]
MSLRFRLVLIPLLLVILALGVIETITYLKIRQTLIQNVDNQMQSSVGTWERYFLSAIPGTGAQDQIKNAETSTYVALYYNTGQLVNLDAQNPYCATPTSSCQAEPVLATNFVVNAASTSSQPQLSTVAGSGGVSSFRVLTKTIRVGPGQSLVLVIAYPLTGVSQTSGRVLGLELVIGALLLAAIAVASWFLVQLGLRPLEQMSTTASEIAAGDLTKRVQDTDTRTEVGQLGAALNVMLSQIERAFAAKEASEEQLRRFIADASHELRTPLTSIRGYAELFKNGGADRPEDLAAALGRIESESVRMGGLVEDLLLLARLDQGRPVSHEEVDIAQLAADAVQDASVVDQSRQVTLIAEQPARIVGDEQRLRQVLGNLVSNALKYSTPASPVEVVVRTGQAVAVQTPPTGRSTGRFGGPSTGQFTSAPLVSPSALSAASATSAEGEQEGAAGAAPRPLGPSDFATGPQTSPGASRVGSQMAAGGIVAVAVVDHGPGIAAEIRPYVFERFWRADPSRGRASGGNGLGLSIVAAVVAAHHGRVTIHSTPGGGTTILVELPIVQPLLSPPPPPPPPSPPANLTTPLADPVAPPEPTEAGGGTAWEGIDAPAGAIGADGGRSE